MEVRSRLHSSFRQLAAKAVTPHRAPLLINALIQRVPVITRMLAGSLHIAEANLDIDHLELQPASVEAFVRLTTILEERLGCQLRESSLDQGRRKNLYLLPGGRIALIVAEPQRTVGHRGESQAVFLDHLAFVVADRLAFDRYYNQAPAGERTRVISGGELRKVVIPQEKLTLTLGNYFTGLISTGLIIGLRAVELMDGRVSPPSAQLTVVPSWRMAKGLA